MMSDVKVTSQLTTKAGPRIAYIMGNFPSLTTTFIDREILQAKRCGSDMVLVSIRRPAPFEMRPEIRSLAEETRYLLPASALIVLRAHAWFLVRRPLTMMRTLFYLLSRNKLGLRSRGKTLIHFAEGVYTAGLLRGDQIDHVHAHFADRAATIALVASRLLDCSYSLTAHANDIYVNPTLIKEKIENAKFATTCTAYNKKHLEELTGQHVELIYHGLDLESVGTKVVPTKQERGGPPLILSVGQLKEKKGFPVLLRACQVLMNRGESFHCEIIGDGPDREDLERMSMELGLMGYVEFVGSQPNARVMERYSDAVAFVLPCVVAKNEDRDGIPNVLLEAMAHELPVISTPVSGIPEIIENDVTGLLAESGNDKSLADAVSRLLKDPGLRLRLGQNGSRLIRDRFDINQNIGRLLELLEQADNP